MQQRRNPCKVLCLHPEDGNIPHASAGIEIIPEEMMPRKVSGEDLKKENKALREENEFLKDKVAYLEALYEIIKQDPSNVMEKKDFPRSGKQ